MTKDPGLSDAEMTARRRYWGMGLARIGGFAIVILGLAIAQGGVPGPWWLGALLAVGGMLAFFFLPPLLARRWKDADRRDEAER